MQVTKQYLLTAINSQLLGCQRTRAIALSDRF
jgi:hypothetical protein